MKDQQLVQLTARIIELCEQHRELVLENRSQKQIIAQLRQQQQRAKQQLQTVVTRLRALEGST